MKEMENISKFGQLVVGEKFRLPGSDVLMIKETLRQELGLGWVNYYDTDQEQPGYFPNDTQVVRRRSNEGKELRMKSQPQKQILGR